MLIGSTSMGKTVEMMDQLDQIRARGHRAIVFDLTGAYISTYFDPCAVLLSDIVSLADMPERSGDSRVRSR